MTCRSNAPKTPANPVAVTIHGIADARVACRAVRDAGNKITLWSAPDAAAITGPAWFAEILKAMRAEFPELKIDGILDCGEFPGYALAALRQGIDHICFRGTAAQRRKIAALAAARGACLETARYDAMVPHGKSAAN